MGENNTTEATPDNAVRVAIVGVGNCASSLVQGVQYYQDADENSTVPGLMHVKFGSYHVRDVKFVAAFDVDAKKVGFDLSEAILASENNTIKIADVPPLDVPVQRGPTLDGIGKYYAQTIEVSDADPVDVVQALKDAQVDVLVSYLPVGSEEADKFYAQCAIDAGVAFVNALPVFIASTWTSRTCSSVSAWSRRRCPRHRPSPRISKARWPARCTTGTFTSARPITSSGSTTASGRTSAWRVAHSVTPR